MRSPEAAHAELQHRLWDLGPNEGIISQAWRVQVVDTPTGVPTRTGRWLDIQHVTGHRDDVECQVNAWLDEPWSDAYTPLPPRVVTDQIADPAVRAAHEAWSVRYGRR